MINDVQTNKLYLSSKIKESKYEPFWTDLSKILSKHKITPTFIEGTRDLWCRDYMPVQINQRDYVQFKYFPDYYLTHKYVSRLTIQKELNYRKPHNIHIKDVDLIIDGGNIVRFGKKAIMTEKVFQENKNRTEESVIKMLKKALQIDDLFFIPVQPYDLTGHSDGMVRFYNESTLLVSDYSKESDSWKKKMDNALNRTRMTILTLPSAYTNDKIDSDEYSAVGCYINYAQIGNIIIFPTFGKNEDGQAIHRIKELYPEPEFTIETIDSRLIAKEGGVLNCLTWNIKVPINKEAISKIVPVYGDDKRMLVIHVDDYKNDKANDYLCIDLHPQAREFSNGWSLQKRLKFGDGYEPISSEADIEKAKRIILQSYSQEEISEISDLLHNPITIAIDSLIWIPERLKPKSHS